MWGCYRPDRSIWALSRALALPISSLHGYFYCCVSNRDGTRTCTHRHKYEFSEEGSWGEASAGIRALLLSWNTTL